MNQFNKAWGSFIGGGLTLAVLLGLLPPDFAKAEVYGAITVLGSTALTVLFPRNAPQGENAGQD